MPLIPQAQGIAAASTAASLRRPSGKGMPSPARLELLDQRRRDVRGRRGHDDRVERRRFLPAVVAVGVAHGDVPVAERFQPGGGLLRERRDDLDGVDLLHERREHGRLIAGAGPGGSPESFVCGNGRFAYAALRTCSGTKRWRGIVRSAFITRGSSARFRGWSSARRPVVALMTDLLRVDRADVVLFTFRTGGAAKSWHGSSTTIAKISRMLTSKKEPI